MSLCCWKKKLMHTRPLLTVFHLQKSCWFFFSSSSVVEMATELFHWQLYEMHFSGRNICTSNQISVQLVNPLSPGWYGNDFKNAIAEYILRTKCMSMSDEIALCWISLCNHVTLYGLASPRLLHSLIDHIKTSHSFKHGYSNGRWVVLYALVSPQWSHAWFRGRVRTILLPATKLYPCVNKLGGSM